MYDCPKDHFNAQHELHQQMPLFFQPWWLDTVCKQWDVVTVASEDPSKSPAAVWPFQRERIAGLTILRNPLLTPYLGPWFLPDDILPVGRKIHLLNELFSKITKFDDFQFTTTPYFNLFAEMGYLGFSNNARRTYYLDLTKTERALWENIHSRRRTYIRRAGRELTVVVEDQPDLETFYRWHKSAFHRKKQYYPYSVPFLKKVVTAARSNQVSLFLTAYNAKNVPVAMLWTPSDRDKAYHLLGAYNPERPVNGAMDLLVWEAIRKARAAGKVIYDFEGSMDAGIAAFFSKFGATPVPYFNFHQNRSFLWRMKLLLRSAK